MHRITQKRFSSQGEKGNELPNLGTFSKDVLTEVYETAYAAVVQPQRVIVLPRYFLQHWLPLLGPARAWLVLAFRQAAFVTRATGRGEVIRPLAVRQLTRWSGLSHGQIWNLLNAPEALGWFVRKLGTPKVQGESTTWGVQAAVPMAPHHLRVLAGEIQREHALFPEKTAEQVLQAVQERLPALLANALPDPEGLPAELRHTPYTLHRIVPAMLGTALTPAVAAVCDEITARVVQPGNSIAISHYFVDRWLPEFKNGEAWLVPLLRSQVYAGGTGTGTVYLSGGKTRLAGWLGVNVRTVRRWLTELEEAPLGAFVRILEQDKSGGLTFEVNLRDPIHALDQVVFEEQAALLEAGVDKTGQMNGQNWTASWTELDRERTELARVAVKSGQVDGQKGTESRTKLNIGEDIPGQEPGQEWTERGTKLETLIDNQLLTSFPGRESNNSFSQAIKNTQKGASPGTPREGDGGEINPIGWNWDQILQAGGLNPGTRRELYERFNADPELGERFLGWLGYAYAHPPNLAGRGGIALPVQFALSRCPHSAPEPVYMALARLDPAELTSLLRNPETAWLEADLHSLAEQLRRTGLLALLEEAMPEEAAFVAHSLENGPPGTGERGKTGAENDAIRKKAAEEAEKERLKWVEAAMKNEERERLRIAGSGRGEAPIRKEVKPAGETWQRILEQAEEAQEDTPGGTGGGIDGFPGALSGNQVPHKSRTSVEQSQNKRGANGIAGSPLDAPQKPSGWGSASWDGDVLEVIFSSRQAAEAAYAALQRLEIPGLPVGAGQVAVRLKQFERTSGHQLAVAWEKELTIRLVERQKLL